ncbi:MAG: LPD29 domain-containing protein [bacterium]
MAYITKEKAREIRNEIKKEFPTKKGWKFSITIKDYSSLNVDIMKAPIKFTEKNYEQLNHYYLENYDNSDVLIKIRDICNKTNYNNSDPMTDYFDVGYYFHLSVGKWDRPFELSIM